MATEEELGKQSIPISELRESLTEWIIKVLVLQQGLIKPYKNSSGEGVCQLLIFVDEEGTKIQTTLFNKDVEKWEKVFKPNHTYYIINGKINTSKPHFLSVQRDMEIKFQHYTEVKESNSVFMSKKFSIGFVPLDEAGHLSNGTLIDIVAILVQVKEVIGEGQTKRHDRKTLTLWGDFTENEGAMLVSFCDVKCDTYQGEFVLSMSAVTSVVLEPKFERVEELLKWCQKMKADRINITLTLSRKMQRAREVTLSNILDGSSDHVKDIFSKFNAHITEIKNICDPIWYAFCKKCYKKVNVIKSSAKCDYCSREDIDYEERYRLKIVVCTVKQHIIITLFDGARYFLGCYLKQYISSTSEKKETSEYYRKMILSKGKKIHFNGEELSESCYKRKEERFDS